MPRVPAGASGSCASTRWTMFSVRSCSPALMKILVPVDAEAAVVRRHGPGADQAEIGAALRLGQAHGARPRAVGEPGQEDRLQPLVGVQRQRVVGALAQAGIGGEGEVGAGEHLVEHEVDQLRQALAAPLGGGGDAGPAAGAEGRVGRLEARAACARRRSRSCSPPRRRSGSAAPARSRPASPPRSSTLSTSSGVASS